MMQSCASAAKLRAAGPFYQSASSARFEYGFPPPRIVGIGIETADMLVNEVLSRPMRDRRAVARYAGLTGAPDESGARRREQGLARAGNARARRGMIQLAWRFLRFQRQSTLALWYRARTADSRIGTRKTMIVALARKLVIAPPHRAEPRRESAGPE